MKAVTQYIQRSFKLALVTDTSINLLLLPMVVSYGQNGRNFPGLEIIFPGEKLFNSKALSTGRQKLIVYKQKRRSQ